jgi:hypothetical protein
MGEQKAVREIMVFLHSHGVGTARAVRIFTYGGDAIQVISENCQLTCSSRRQIRRPSHVVRRPSPARPSRSTI